MFLLLLRLLLFFFFFLMGRLLFLGEEWRRGGYKWEREREKGEEGKAIDSGTLWCFFKVVFVLFIVYYFYIWKGIWPSWWDRRVVAIKLVLDLVGSSTFHVVEFTLICPFSPPPFVILVPFPSIYDSPHFISNTFSFVLNTFKLKSMCIKTMVTLLISSYLVHNMPSNDYFLYIGR